MQVTTKTITKLHISTIELEEIVRSWVKNKGYNVERFDPIITTVYERGIHDDHGTEVLIGIDIIALNEERTHKE